MKNHFMGECSDDLIGQTAYVQFNTTCTSTPGRRLKHIPKPGGSEVQLADYSFSVSAGDLVLVVHTITSHDVNIDPFSLIFHFKSQRFGWMQRFLLYESEPPPRKGTFHI